jgi:putative tryptophan/tyrosine transport system substrate-binding protein
MKRREFIASRRGDRVMNRRAVIAGLGAAAASPFLAHAQQAALPVVGVLGDATAEASQPRLAGLRRGLSQMGFVDGKNMAIEPRWAEGDYELLPRLATDLVRRRVAVIVTTGSERPTRAAKAATDTIPIVAVVAGDPVARGLVTSINRPAGNLTVVSLFTSSNNALVAKRVELMHELVPKAASIGWLADAHILDFEEERRDFEAGAQALGLAAKIAPVAREGDIEAGVRSLVEEGAAAILAAGPLIGSHRGQVIALAARAGVPMMYEWRQYVEDGGLMSYGTDLADIFRHAGIYAGRILKGERVGDLPVVQSDKFALVLNLKTAKALGLDVPPSLLARADEVME